MPDVAFMGFDKRLGTAWHWFPSFRVAKHRQSKAALHWMHDFQSLLQKTESL